MNKGKVMTSNAKESMKVSIPRLLKLHAQVQVLYVPPVDWSIFDNHPDPDIITLVPAWKEYCEAKERLDKVIKNLSSKRATEIMYSK
jgi:pyoverdine/dityrosine biosynthesis protein Dit1